MKYETPELKALTPAINAIQAFKNDMTGVVDNPVTTPRYELGAAYADWE